MRKLLLLALLAPAVAHADGEPAKTSTTDLVGMSTFANQTPCQAILAMEGGPPGKCKKVTSKKVKGVGTATVFSVYAKDEGWTRYVMEIDDGAGNVGLSPPFDFVDDCAMMKCDTVKKVKPKLRAVTVQGVATAALELDASMSFEMTDPDDGKTMGKIPYHRHVFAACGKNPSGKWMCATADLGTHDAPCTASLDTSGLLRYACEDLTELSLGQ